MMTCSMCGEEKHQEEFPKNGVDKVGATKYRTECKVCYNVNRKAGKKKKHTKFMNNVKHRTGEENCYTIEDWKAAMLHFRGECAYCGTSQSRSVRITKDHIVAVSSGGMTVRGNIAPACISCNSSKSSNDMETWFKKQKFYSVDRHERLRRWMHGSAEHRHGCTAASVDTKINEIHSV